jgi:AcrR family transcriptional regulator
MTGKLRDMQPNLVDIGVNAHKAEAVPTRRIAKQQPWATREKSDRADSVTRAVLVDAAQRVFERLGYARTTVGDITAEAGVGRATFYVYFASKEDVFAAVADHVCERFLAAQEITGLDADDPHAVLQATNAAFLDAYTANLAFIKVLEHQALTDPAIDALREEIHARPIGRTARYLDRLVAKGAVEPAVSPESIARASVGMVAMFAPVVAADPAQRQRVVNDLTAMFLRLLGLGPDS